MVELLSSNLAWFEKYRPQTIDDVVFEDNDTRDQITEFVNRGVVSGNIISYGDGGTGKSTINQVIYQSIIKNRSDIFKLKKSVKGMDELRSWLLDVPQGSTQKIVVCEEFDRLSKEAQSELKDGLMEKYMPETAFLATTNNIQSIDPALLQRFNIKLNFTKFNIDGVYFRMLKILDAEKVTYNTEDVYQLVNQYQHKGIRNLINALQSGTINSVFDSKHLKGFTGTSGIEDLIINWTKYIFSVINADQDIENVYMTCLYPNQNDTIAPYFEKMVEHMKTEPSINYEYIYKTLLDDEDTLMPLKKIFEKHYQQLKLVPLKHIHYQSALFECWATLYSIKGGEKRLIH